MMFVNMNNLGYLVIDDCNFSIKNLYFCTFEHNHVFIMLTFVEVIYIL